MAAVGTIAPNRFLFRKGAGSNGPDLQVYWLLEDLTVSGFHHLAAMRRLPGTYIAEDQEKRKIPRTFRWVRSQNRIKTWKG